MRLAGLLLVALTLAPPCASAQTSVCIEAGRAGNHSGEPFEQWGSGWQAGLGLEHRLKGWLAAGVGVDYVRFGSAPAGYQPSWLAPALLYFRLMHAKAILGTNLRLSGGAMAARLGAETGETITTEWKPFLQIGAGIKVPLTPQLGLAFDIGYQRTLDDNVALVPVTLGLCH